MDVVFIVLIIYFLSPPLLFIILQIRMERFNRYVSEHCKPYDGPAGEPRWYGTLPQKVDDYVCPRYVYENLVESTEFLPENGRIIGYRISPTLVIHSRIINRVNTSFIPSYISRLTGKLLEVPDALCLRQNWEAVSALRQKAGDTPLQKTKIWCTQQGCTLIINPRNGKIRKKISSSDIEALLILKR